MILTQLEFFFQSTLEIINKFERNNFLINVYKYCKQKNAQQFI